MSIAIWAGIYGILLGYGTGVRITLWQQRKAAERVAAEFMAHVERLDQAITAAETRAQAK